MWRVSLLVFIFEGCFPVTIDYSISVGKNGWNDNLCDLQLPVLCRTTCALEIAAPEDKSLARSITAAIGGVAAFSALVLLLILMLRRRGQGGGSSFTIERVGDDSVGNLDPKNPKRRIPSGLAAPRKSFMSLFLGRQNSSSTVSVTASRGAQSARNSQFRESWETRASTTAASGAGVFQTLRALPIPVENQRRESKMATIGYSTLRNFNEKRMEMRNPQLTSIEEACGRTSSEYFTSIL